MTEGCGKQNCSNTNCASNPNFVKPSASEAAALAIRLAKEKAELCEGSAKSAKQFKPSIHQSPSEMSSSSSPTTSNKKNETNNGSNQRNNQDDDDDFDDYEDDEDVVISRPSSNMNVRPSSAASTSSKSSDLKSLNDALKDAVKYVTQINQTKPDEENKKIPYLSENRISNLIKKCKNCIKETEMEVDGSETSNTNNNNKFINYLPLLKLVQRVFQSYKSLSLSFTFRNEEGREIEMSSRVPSIPPFNIDFNSLRRSYSLLFEISNDEVVEEICKAIDLSVYALCVSIRMVLKKKDITDEELNEITHSLLVVNELPLLDDPKYMDRCAKIFYATMSELPVSASVKIIRLWSKWHVDELKPILEKLQQYITVCVISKNLDEENNRNNEEDDEDESNENERNCLHKNEGISGAVGCLKLIYYASVLGGRLDPEDQIKKERELELEETKYFEDSNALEEQNYFSEVSNYLNQKLEPIEEELNIRSIDCREPKIPFEQFINEEANKFIDIQHDYVEYIQQVQNLESQLNLASTSSNRSNKHKNIFSFLANPFFLVLAKKNLGLYYDNKIKMMRERRNNIMMSLIEGRVPSPYFKIRLSRQNLLVEALSIIELQEQENPAYLRKQLFIEFENEQGIDQGGVSKEFFQLAIDELLNKGYSKIFFSFLLKIS